MKHQIINVQSASSFIKAFHSSTEELNSGCFATVHLSNDGKRVYKSFTRDDPAYLKFIDLARECTDNPYLPKIYGIWDLMEPDYHIGNTIIAMEVLTPIDCCDFDNALIAQIRGILYDGIFCGEVAIVWPDKLDKYEEALVCVLDAYNASKSFLDLHAGNCMYRGDQIVITDPLGSMF